MRSRMWESRYADPVYRQTLTACFHDHQYTDRVLKSNADYLCDNMLVSVQDDSHGHPVVQGRTVLLDTHDVATLNQINHVKAFAHSHRLGIINYGWRSEGFAITFRTELMACKFRLLFNGTTRIAAA